VGLLRGGATGPFETEMVAPADQEFQDVSADGRGILVDADAVAVTDGRSDGSVLLIVEDADGNIDHIVKVVVAPAGLGADEGTEGSIAGVYAPPGGRYALNASANDPTGNNAIQGVREVRL